MNKHAVVKKIIAELAKELELFARAARAAHAEATHEQSKAENKYDTRGLEASYLARGQSRQIAEIEQAVEQYESLPLRPFATNDPIDLGALVELELNKERLFYFIGPRAGGREIRHDKKSVLVLTPQSPLGQHLMGKKQGDGVKMDLGDVVHAYKIVAVA